MRRVVDYESDSTLIISPKAASRSGWFVHVVEVVNLGMSETEMRLVERMIHEHLVHRVGTIRENLDLAPRQNSNYIRNKLLPLPSSTLDYNLNPSKFDRTFIARVFILNLNS